MRQASIDAMLAHPHDRMGAYTLLSPIGTGGMGAVYLARKHGIDEPDRYAIKVMLPHLTGDDRFVSLFLHEARIAIRVRHPNVCRVIDYGSEKGTYYIAMELLRGRTLSASLTQLAAAPPSDAQLVRRVLMTILTDVADGLEHAHELADDSGRPLQVVHRDVCPPNVFVTDEGIAKILDFGIALYADRSFQTTTGEMRGHLAYVAPEILAGMRADRSADVWSLAVIVWEALASQRLFRRESEAATISAVLHEPIPSLSKWIPGIPPAVDAAIARGLDRDRSRRSTSAAALMRAVSGAFGFERASASEVAECLTRWLAGDTEECDAALATAAYNQEVETVLSPREHEHEHDALDALEASATTPRRRPRAQIVGVVGIAALSVASIAYLLAAADGGARATPMPSSEGPVPLALHAPDEAPDDAPRPVPPNPSLPPAAIELAPDVEPEQLEAGADSESRDGRRRLRARAGELVVPAGGEWSEVWVD